MIRIIKPTLEYADDIMAYRKEFIESGDSMDGCGKLRSCETAEEWFREIERYSNAITCPTDRVPSYTYIALRLSDHRIVGICDLRHHINHPVLSLWGGHIGYSVRPNERRKGYGKEMLRLVLNEARALGLERVMITCNSDNIASEKTIIANGGVFEKDVIVDNEVIKRYWIEL